MLNGGSSSGKSGIARCLQAILPDPWLAFGTDNLVQALPMSLQTSAPRRPGPHRAGASARTTRAVSALSS